MKITIKRFDKTIDLPAYEKRDFLPACFDFKARTMVTIPPKTIGMIPLNIAIKIPEGYALMIYPRSSTPLRKGLMAPHSVGILDSFYCGDQDEAIYPLYNFTDQAVTVNRGEILVQAMVIKAEKIEFEEVDHLPDQGVGGYVLEPLEK